MSLSLCAQKITSVLTHANIIKKEDREIYIYCFELFLSTVINFIVLFVIACAAEMVWETLLFLIGFIPLRKLSGGYHAKTHFRCFLVLLGTYFVFLAVISFVPVELYMWTIMISLLVSVTLIWTLSPIEDCNKPLNPEEKGFFRRRSRTILLIYTLLIVPLIIFSPTIEIVSVSIGVLSVALSLVAARIKHRFHMDSMAQSQE